MTADGPGALVGRLLEAGTSVAALSRLLARPDDAASVLATLAPMAAAAEREVPWVVANEGRIDATITAISRTWRIVVLVDAAGLVSSVHAYERPPDHEGHAGGRAVVLNGPSGVGKSSLMEALLGAAEAPWVMFDEPWLGTVAQPYLIWHDVAPQLHRGFLDGIAALARADNQVILAAGGASQAALQLALAGVPTLYVGLDCSLPTLLERERGRPDRWGGLAEASLDVHDGWTYDLRLDTESATPADLAATVLAATIRPRQ